MATTDYNLKLNIEADNKASWELDKVSKSTENLQKQTLQRSKSAQATFKKISIWASVVTAWMVALWKTFISSAMDVEPLRNSFERLSETAKISADEMIKWMRKASRWTVADVKLMEAANKAYSLWIVSSVEDMTTMMEIARVKGQAMWRTMEEALDDIVTWLWRWSVQILDNLWIVIKQTEAQELYAKQLWKTVDQLTEAEKKQALVNAVVQQWKEELASAWEVQETMQEKVARLNAQRDNTKATIWNALIPVFDRLLTSLTPIIEKVVDWIEKNPELTANILLVTTAVAWLTAWITTILPVLWTVVTVLSWPAWWIVALAWVTAWLYALDSKLKTTDEQIAEYRKQLEAVTEAYNNGSISVDEYRVQTELLNSKIAEAEARHRTLWWYIEDNFKDTLHSLLYPMDENNGWLRAWIDLLWMLWEWINNIASKIYNVFIKSIDSAIAKLKELREWGQKAAQYISSWFQNAVSSAKSFVSNAVDTLTWKANWWPVSWWTAYIVGERWPELFVPSTSWNIIPNENIVNNNGITVNVSWVSVRNDNDIQSITDEIIRKIKLEKSFWIA